MKFCFKYLDILIQYYIHNRNKNLNEISIYFNINSIENHRKKLKFRKYTSHIFIYGNNWTYEI